ncbi:TetR/AcrR family transcriptional regulator [Paenibacillus psychroresistens]|uniref:TetR/AcrR family transcriptional regulator n=1 Tax=Paenibacillus psychroresistens TaxID=1778678 RepID=A0A6B8RL75_9BACL|nr:TetR/AcrR family transcriptional regulator [Paenibacillus psychroresistens]QGQ96176.1 TetR/AcrR family transcriptional regulator [Paenibacillus psychroresistens]
MPVNANDPRVKRTRQLLMQAFTELLDQKKNIYSISVIDITTRATVNRATFYAHFEDKFAFLENWMLEKSKMILKKRLPEESLFTFDCLPTLIQTVFEFLKGFRKYIAPGDKQIEPMFEIAMQKEVHQLLLKWLREEAVTSVSQERLEATALVISWGIFGSALQWSRNTQGRTVETMVKEVMGVIAASLVPVLEPRTK